MAEHALIIGGTGMLGRPVAKRLREDGFAVTIGTTNVEKAKARLGEGYEYRFADVTDVESLKRAIDGHRYVHLNLHAHLDSDLYRRIEVDGTANVAQIAKQCGVARMSTITGTTAADGEVGPIFRRAKARAEQGLKASGVPYSIMRPSWFFETLPQFVVGKHAAVLGRQPHPRRWLAADDYARQISTAYRTEEAANKCFHCLGPEPMTILRAVERYCERFHPEVVAAFYPFWLARLTSWLPGQKNLRTALPFFRFFDEYVEKVDSAETDRILGENRTTLDQWMAQRAAPLA